MGLLSSLILMNASPSVFANTPANMPLVTPKDETMFNTVSSSYATPPTQNTLPIDNPPTTAITKAELLADIDLFNEVLSQAIDRDDVQGVQILLPVYALVPHKDELLYLYAHAIIQERQDIERAIDHYRQMLAINPSLTPIRIRLILAYLANHQPHTAKEEFAIAQTDPTLPLNIATSLQKQLDDFDKPMTRMSLRYLDDDNVNNAPTTTHHQGWQLPHAESAHGVGYFAKLSKEHYPKDHLAVGMTASVQGKYYWDNKDYNDTLIEVAPTLTHRSRDRQLGASIYHQIRYFGHEPYSDITGLRLTAYERFNATYQGEVGLDIAKKRHDTRSFLDGSSQAVTASLSHHGRHHHYVGIGLINENTQEPSESYRQGMMFVGSDRVWGKFGTSHHVGIGRRTYQDIDFFNIKRADMLYHTEHSIWHQNVHYRGYHPRLHVRFDRIDSNHFAHDTKNVQVFLSINRRF